ncbi:hypothetical protein EDC01DRAFT_441927 [Geopyxis carbonaria]|nr:hypothetical protein EDC01DRAFT_441927 [Geopyxis carbonaria]
MHRVVSFSLFHFFFYIFFFLLDLIFLDFWTSLTLHTYTIYSRLRDPVFRFVYILNLGCYSCLFLPLPLPISSLLPFFTSPLLPFFTSSLLVFSVLFRLWLWMWMWMGMWMWMWV